MTLLRRVQGHGNGNRNSNPSGGVLRYYREPSASQISVKTLKCTAQKITPAERRMFTQGGRCACVSVLRRVRYPVSEFRFFGIVPTIRCADEIAGDPFDAFKTHVLSRALRICQTALFHPVHPLLMISYCKPAANTRGNYSTFFDLLITGQSYFLS